MFFSRPVATDKPRIRNKRALADRTNKPLLPIVPKTKSQRIKKGKNSSIVSKNSETRNENNTNDKENQQPSAEQTSDNELESRTQSVAPLKKAIIPAISIQETEDESMSFMQDFQDKHKDRAFEYYLPIMQVLKTKEIEYMKDVRNDYMRTVQKDISFGMRSILVDWLVEVQEEFRLQPSTFYLAVNYADRYLSKMSVHRVKLQLVGITAMMLAAKFYEISPPSLDEWIYISDDQYTSSEIRVTEKLMLKVLDWKMAAPTIDDFMPCWLSMMDASKQHIASAQFLSELCLVEHFHFQLAPSKLVASILLMCIQQYSDLSVSQQTFEGICGYSVSALKSTCHTIHDLLSSAVTKKDKQTTPASYRKFCSTRYHSASLHKYELQWSNVWSAEFTESSSKQLQ